MRRDEQGTDQPFTLRQSTSSAVGYLAVEPGDRHRLIADPTLIPTAVEEFFRYFSPLAQIGRTATESVTAPHGVTQQGDLVSLGFAFVNHDPEGFDNTDVCIIDPKPNRHVAFGHGPHTCIGAHLARLEARVVLEELLTRSQKYQVEGTPRFRFDDLGFTSIPAGIESCTLSNPSR